MLLPALVASVLLCLLSSCWAGDPCPSKAELKFCTCRHFSLNNGLTPLHTRRRRQIEPFSHPLSANDSITILPTGIPKLATTLASSRNTPYQNFKVSEGTETNDEWVGGSRDFEGGDLDLEVIMGRSRGVIEEMDESNSDQFTSVECKEPKTITEFEEVLLFALHRKLVDKLIVSNIPPLKDESLARLPSMGMRYTRIKQFEIRNTALFGDFIWYGNPFEGQAHSLLRFSANLCYLYGALTYDEPGTINTKGLHLLPRIEVLDFSNNHLTIVKVTAFKIPPANLSNIILSSNSLETLEPGCFQLIPRLKLVDLSRNLLKTVDRTIFAAPAMFLETINLSWNFLENLPENFFINMTALKIVNLSKNFIHNLKAEPWATVWRQLTSVDVSNNFLDCDCQMMWLLPILSPTPKKGKNATTPSPSPKSRQTVIGMCNYYRRPGLIPAQYALISLTKEKLMCR